MFDGVSTSVRGDQLTLTSLALYTEQPRPATPRVASVHKEMGEGVLNSVTTAGTMDGMNPELPSVEVSEVQPLRDAGATLLDVRENDEWAAGHIEGALHVPMHQIPARVAELPPGPLVVVCKMGGRSAQVTAWLHQQGHDARNLDGGMLAWAVAHQPMAADDGRAPTVA